MKPQIPLLPGIPAPLVVIVGPTAVGKTEIALRVAERLNGEIISADSRLFYHGMDIGTAKPTLAERARVPHHLIDVSNPDETWSLTIFQSAAREALEGIYARGRLPFLVGGTGQYVWGMMHGWEVPPQEPDPALRLVLENWAKEIGPYGLHARLAVVDPAAAAFIDARNVRRTIRALEVTLSSGKPFSSQRQHLTSPYSLLIIGLKRPRVELYQRVDQRIDAMLASGFVDEVRGLLARGYAPNLSPMSAIGYREIIAYLRGRMTLEEARTQMKRLTRRYIRQQANWFKENDTNIHWFTASEPVEEDIEALIRSGKGWIAPGTPLET